MQSNSLSEQLDRELYLRARILAERIAQEIAGHAPFMRVSLLDVVMDDLARAFKRQYAEAYGNRR